MVQKQIKVNNFSTNSLLCFLFKLCIILSTLCNAVSMTLHKAWVQQHWCKSVVKPHWPFSYQRNLHIYSAISKATAAYVTAKGHGFSNGDFIIFTGEQSMTEVAGNVYQVRDIDENGFKIRRFDISKADSSDPYTEVDSSSFSAAGTGGVVSFAIGFKGRTMNNYQNLGHTCGPFGTRSKCHHCMDIDCGANLDKRCSMQIQGVNYLKLPRNIPSLSDTPFAVDGAHRNDFGGATTSHICLMLSGGICVDPLTEAEDFKTCAVRCWGYGQDSPVPQPAGPFGVRWSWSKKKGNAQGIVETLAGGNGPGYLDGHGNIAKFNKPGAIVADSLLNLYICDTGNNCIRKVDKDGIVSTFAGICEHPGGSNDGPVDEATFDFPQGISLWTDNGVLVVYVADTNNHRIREIRNGIVSTLAGQKSMNPAPGYRDGTAVEARFDHPSGVATDEHGTSFVADTYNHLIRRVEPDGTVTTAAGNTTHYFDGDNYDDTYGCPPPCLHGVPGHRDGALFYARFYFPRDVTIGLNSTVLITDGHRVRRITTEGYSMVQNILSLNRVTTVAGQLPPGKQDGSGPLSSFNNPRGIAMTNQGTIYVADYVGSRLRRIGRSLQLAPKLNCLTSAFNLKRPSGCASYDPPEDAFFLKGTPTAGNIYYNLGMYLTTNDMVSADAGGEPVGKRIMNCQGPKPPDFGPTSSGKTIFHDGGTGYYRDEKSDQMTYAMEESGFNTQFIVNCPAGCANSTGQVVGNIKYADFSSVCRSAIHDGQVDDETGGNIAVNTIGEKKYFESVTRFGVTSTLRTLPWPSSFQTFRLPEARVVVESVAGLPGAILDDVRGYQDGRPPTETKFNGLIDIAAIPGKSLSNETKLYMVDQNNHAIRTVTAVCTKVCENGGVCRSENFCLCPPGWGAEDCTSPICDDIPLSQRKRKICVGPNEFKCIPGWTGNDCLTALCVQTCEHGGLCTAPDTCTCAAGWFDPNCTTPTCHQTCGNGGNCTSPNVCTCPSDWQGNDCRTPVCTQTCQNGGSCVAPNTCQCVDEYSGYDCSKPVCTQGAFVADPSDRVGANYNPSSAANANDGWKWKTYVPCLWEEWCRETNGFDCNQTERLGSIIRPHEGNMAGTSSGRLKATSSTCMPMELSTTSRTSFQYNDQYNRFSPHWRESPTTVYNYSGENEWSSYPLESIADRVVVFVELREIVQGVYGCSNGGSCVQPGQCDCKKDSNGNDLWVGFDCRIPVCSQGYYEPFFSERFPTLTSDDRRPEHPDGQEKKWADRYAYQGNKQGWYSCSARLLSAWENPNYMHSHPNYFSRYMDGPKLKQTGYSSISNDWVSRGEDDHIYYWEGMDFPRTHTITNEPSARDNIDIGYLRRGVWEWKHQSEWGLGNGWRKGKCSVEYMRKCGRNEVQELIVTVNQAPTISNQVGGYFRLSYDAWSKQPIVNTYVQHIDIQPIQLAIYNDPVRYPEPIIPACQALILCRMFPGTVGTAGYTTNIHPYQMPFYYTGAGHVFPYTLKMLNTYWDTSGWPKVHKQICISHPTCTGVTKVEPGIIHYLDSARLTQRDIMRERTPLYTCIVYSGRTCQQFVYNLLNDNVKERALLDNFDKLKASYIDGKKWVGYLLNRAHVSGNLKTTSSALEIQEALEDLDSIGSVTVSKETIVEDGGTEMCERYIYKDCPAFDQSQTRMFTMYQCPTCTYDPDNDPKCVCAQYNFPYEGCGNWGKGMSSETIVWGDGCHGHRWSVEFTANFGDVDEIEVSADAYSGFTYGNKAIACDDNRNIECTLQGGKTFGSPPTYIGPGTVLSVFTRQNGTVDHAKAVDLRTRRYSIPVLNTDAAFRPRVASTTQFQSAIGRWNDAGGQCLDTVIRGCYNNGTCIAPGRCQCAPGYSGHDCSVPVCINKCQNFGNCTAPNVCTCEKGWSGHDCSVALCAQECANGGLCTAPDVCTCKQWWSLWRDAREGGGRPLYRQENGDPQYTGWTGYDCSTPICVQAEKFVLNVRTGVALTRLGGRHYEFPNVIEQCVYPPNAASTFTCYLNPDKCDTDVCKQYLSGLTTKERIKVLQFMATPLYGIIFGDEPLNNLVTMSSDKISCDVPMKMVNGKAVCAGERSFGEIFTQIMDDLSSGGQWVIGDGDVLRNNGKFFQAGCGQIEPDYYRSPPGHRYRFEGSGRAHRIKGYASGLKFHKDWERTDDNHLCNVLTWQEGDFKLQNASIEFEINPYQVLNPNQRSKRRIRVNHISYVRDGPEDFIKDPAGNPKGEGIYACYNRGSCIHPDMCICPDGFGGIDCNTPLCRHIQTDVDISTGEVVGCLNGGICRAKDACKCITTESVLYTVEPDAKDFPLFGENYHPLTGYGGKDCSMPICVQGFYDPKCTGIAGGGEGCYRCANLGNCTAPDYCTCSEGWEGYDCMTPICTTIADAEMVEDLKTIDPGKVLDFELDPCRTNQLEQVPLDWGKYSIGRGNCTAPNYCTCLCIELYPYLVPWVDPLERTLEPGLGYGPEGTCEDGFMGMVNEEDEFYTCHLQIKVPTELERNTLTYLILFSFLAVIVLFIYWRVKKYLRRRYLLKKAERRRSRKSSESSEDKGPTARARRSSETIGR